MLQWLPTRLPPPQERAGSSGTNRHSFFTKAQRIVSSTNEKDAPPPVSLPLAPAVLLELIEDEEFVAEPFRKQKARRPTKPFIEREAGLDEYASAD